MKTMQLQGVHKDDGDDRYQSKAKAYSWVFIIAPVYWTLCIGANRHIFNKLARRYQLTSSNFNVYTHQMKLQCLSLLLINVSLENK